MNLTRVNVKQTESRKESSNRAASAEARELSRMITELEDCKQRGILTTTGKRQLARFTSKLAELIAEETEA